MENFRRKILLVLGWLIILIGLTLGLIPGPGGIPIVATGSMLVLSQSLSARRQFVRLQKRFPKILGPIRRIISRRKNKKANADAAKQ